MIKNTTGILLAFFILVQSLFVHSNVSNLVLCFGNDGHIAIEAIVSAKTDGEAHNCIHLVEFQSEKNRNQTTPIACQDIHLKTQLTDFIHRQANKIKATQVLNYFIKLQYTKIFHTFLTVILNKNYIVGISNINKIKTIVLQL